MAEEMCEYLANGTCFEVYGNGEFHRKLQEDHNFDYSYIKNMCNESSAAGTEIEIQESGGALASGAEEKLPLLF